MRSGRVLSSAKLPATDDLATLILELQATLKDSG